jgi:type IV pilus assembly protein PilP
MMIPTDFKGFGMWRIVLGAGAALFLTGCIQVEGLDDLRKYVQETRSAPSGKIEPLPEFKPYESFLYRATSLRGPFQPLIRVEVTDEQEEIVKNDLKPDFDRPKEPLEAFKIELLSMVGTIHMIEGGDLTALIKDGNGEIHRVQKGNFIGRNFGEIAQVNETQLDIVEIVPNGRDGWMKRPRNLVLVEINK